jgi:hypothetical protein
VRIGHFTSSGQYAQVTLTSLLWQSKLDRCLPLESATKARANDLSQGRTAAAWCLDSKLSRKVDLEGWEVVAETDAMGVLMKFRLKDRPADQTLIKKRNG